MANAVSYVKGIIPSDEREKDDFYPTPPEGTEALLQHEKFNGSIWEPACGDGAISRVLERHGYDVFSSDLVDRGYGESGWDFLMEYQRQAPNIITNPPFKHAQEFAEKALILTTGKVAMLCRLAWLEGIARKEMFERTPLKTVYVFSKRLHMAKGGEEVKSGMIAFAWYVWEHGYEGDPRIKWINPVEIEVV